MRFIRLYSYFKNLKDLRPFQIFKIPIGTTLFFMDKGLGLAHLVPSISSGWKMEKPLKGLLTAIKNFSLLKNECCFIVSVLV